MNFSSLPPELIRSDNKDLYVIVLYERGQPPVDYVLLASGYDEALERVLPCFARLVHRSVEEIRATCKYEVIPLTAEGFLIIGGATQLKSQNPKWISGLSLISESQEEDDFWETDQQTPPQTGDTPQQARLF